MNIKIFIASVIVAIVLAAISFFVNFTSLFPAPLAIFTAALVSGSITSYWVCSAEGLTEISTEAEPRKQKSKPAGDASKETGSVKWFSTSKGFGFITRDNGEDVFVHFRSIMGKGHRILREGQRVEFAVTEGTKGPQAEEVTPLNS